VTIGAERFAREIDIAAHLTHPHIVPLHDSGSANGLLFYVMPYIEGQALRQRLARDGQLAVTDAVQLAAEVADALDYAHRRGVVHRDIKPENILLAGGHAMVADFGIARALIDAGGPNITNTGALLGTPAYMSPEQAESGAVDGRTDQYALACVMHEMLSGNPPFPGTTPQGVLVRHLREAPPSLRAVRPMLPEHVMRAIEVALAKSPADRFRTAGDFRAALLGTGPAQRSRLPVSRHIWPVVGVAAAMVALAALTSHWWRARSAPRFQARDWILVADFDGPSDDPSLGDAVRELATAELNQSSFLSPVPRQQLTAAMRLAQVPESTHVGPQLARELAYRSAVRAVLVGSINRLGGPNYSVVLHVVDAADGTDIVSVAGAATDSTLVTSVQRLAREVRESLGERRAAVEANLPLDQVATPSFAAYRRYIEGLKLQEQGDGIGSNRVLRESLALDTGFASAWYLIGWNYLNDRKLDSARLAFGEALKRPDRLGVPRRYRVEADAAYAIRYDLIGAIRSYDLYLDHFPRSYSVLNSRGLYVLALGRYEDALRDFDQAVKSHPFGPRQAQVQLLNQAATLVTLGRLDEARVAARRLTGPFAEYEQLMLAAATDHWAQADSVATSVAEAPSSPNWLRAQAVATAASARGYLARAALTTAPEVARWYGRARLLLSEAAGRRAPPVPSASVKDTSAAGLVTYGLWAAAAGDVGFARRCLKRLIAFPEDVRAPLGYGPDLLEASIAARAGHWGEVIRVIGPAASRGEHDSTLLDRVNSLSLRWLAALAYAQLGRTDSAAAMMELVIRPTRMPGNAYAQRGITFPFAHRRLALWYAMLGKPEQARAHWRVVLETVRTPDADLTPLVEEARRAYTGLGGTD
jgi:serine/threonine-protein kinase